MKIAVVQHAQRANASADAEGLFSAAQAAASAGGEFVVMPEVFSLHGDPARDALYERLGELDGMRFIPHVGRQTQAFAYLADHLEGLEQLGRVALVVGDAVMDPAELERIAENPPSVLLLAPRSESDLQAEAVLELAIALSESVAGLVVISETSGAEPGEPGHGGSAIVLLGEVVAEALAPDDVLVIDVPVPVPVPEPREPLPPVPPILLQRLASHHGEKVPTDYPADLS